MIRLYRNPDSAEADAIEERLANMCLARDVITVQSEADLPNTLDVDADHLPALVDGDTVATGPEAIDAQLDVLQRALDDWYRFQSDTCELSADGKVC